MNIRKPISKSLRFQVLRRDNFRCRYCGACPPDVVLHLDHVHAVAKGGTNDLDNLVTACLPCNIGKGVVSVDLPQELRQDGSRSAPPIEFFWDRDWSPPLNPLREARCIIRPTLKEDDAPWEWSEFNHFWNSHRYSTHGASTMGFSPYEAAMYAVELLHMKWISFEAYTAFLDDLITVGSLGLLPQYIAPSVLRATHYESVVERCGRVPRDYQDIADAVAGQAIATFQPFMDQQHLPWRRA